MEEILTEAVIEIVLTGSRARPVTRAASDDMNPRPNPSMLVTRPDQPDRPSGDKNYNRRAFEHGFTVRDLILPWHPNTGEHDLDDGFGEDLFHEAGNSP